MKKKSKSFKNFIKDLVFNNPRADRQAGSMDNDVPDLAFVSFHNCIM